MKAVTCASRLLLIIGALLSTILSYKLTGRKTSSRSYALYSESDPFPEMSSKAGRDGRMPRRQPAAAAPAAEPPIYSPKKDDSLEPPFDDNMFGHLDYIVGNVLPM